MKDRPTFPRVMLCREFRVVSRFLDHTSSFALFVFSSKSNGTVSIHVVSQGSSVVATLQTRLTSCYEKLSPFSRHTFQSVNTDVSVDYLQVLGVISDRGLLPTESVLTSRFLYDTIPSMNLLVVFKLLTVLIFCACLKYPRFRFARRLIDASRTLRMYCDKQANSLPQLFSQFLQLFKISQIPVCETSYWCLPDFADVL